MKYKEWFELHKDDPREWHIGELAGWMFVGKASDSETALREVINKSYEQKLEAYNRSVSVLDNCERYLASIGATLDTVQTTLTNLQKSFSNVKRTLIKATQSVKEPTPPLPLGETEVKEEYVSVLGQNCLVLDGTCQGSVWDKEEYVQYLKDQIQKLGG